MHSGKSSCLSLPVSKVLITAVEFLFFRSLRHIVSKSNVGDLIPAFRKEESEVIRKVGRKKRRRKSSEETEQTESDTEVDASSKNKNEEAQVHL